MKKVLTIVLAGVSTLAFAQKKIDLSRSIDDDGKKLSISVHGTVDGKRIDYDKTFSVNGLSKQERTELADNILDSLGLEKIEAPSPPRPPQAPQEPRAPKPPVHFSVDKSDNHTPVMVWVEDHDDDSDDHDDDSDDDHDDAVPTENSKPYDKKVKYDSGSGELYLRYQFMKNGDEFIYEKTVNAREKSEKQRQNIILNFEKEIALPGSLIQ